jgi:hypothetical protein
LGLGVFLFGDLGLAEAEVLGLLQVALVGLLLRQLKSRVILPLHRELLLVLAVVLMLQVHDGLGFFLGVMNLFKCLFLFFLEHAHTISQ